MLLDELENHINIILSQFMVASRKFVAMKGISTHFVVEDFGLIVCCINRVDYSQASNDVIEQFKGWQIFYVTTNDNIGEVKYNLLWALMRGGYMKWLRTQFPRQVKNVINGPENLGRRIIEERLRIWADRPKFKFLIDDNRAALNGNLLRELTNDPSFFDFMPSEE
jgi:hypothetical protein